MPNYYYKLLHNITSCLSFWKSIKYYPILKLNNNNIMAQITNITPPILTTMSLTLFITKILINLGIIQPKKSSENVNNYSKQGMIQFVVYVGSYLRTFPFIWNDATMKFEKTSRINHFLWRINCICDFILKSSRTIYFFISWKNHQLDMTRIMLHSYVLFASVLCYAPLLTSFLREDDFRNITNGILDMERRLKG